MNRRFLTLFAVGATFAGRLYAADAASPTSRSARCLRRPLQIARPHSSLYCADSFRDALENLSNGQAVLQPRAGGSFCVYRCGHRPQRHAGPCCVGNTTARKER